MGRKADPRHRADPASFAEFARRAGVHRSSVTRLVASKLSVALLADGRLDAAHPAVAAWARSHGIKPAALLSRLAGSDDAPTGTAPPAARAPRAPTGRRPKSPEGSPPAQPDRPAADAIGLDGDPLTAANIERYADMTLRQVSAQFGNLRAFADEADVLKKIEDTRRLYLQNEESEGELISRELVRGHVFSWLDGLARKLLRDSAKTIVRRVYAMAKSGADIEAAEAVARDNMSAQIQPAKAQIGKALRGA
jgi:hypothetical protein